MGLFGTLFGSSKRKASSGLPPEMERIFEKMARMMDDENIQNSMYPLAIKNQIVDGLDVDELPYAIGDFGHSMENPIPVNGSIGELIYLSRLRIESVNQRLLFHRLGSVEGIDIYETVTIDGSIWDILFFSMYHPRKSRKAPFGYSIADLRDQPLLYGTNRRVEGFPYGLQEAVGATTEEIFGIPMSPPQIRQAEETVKFRRPPDHEDLIRTATASVTGFRD